MTERPRRRLKIALTISLIANLFLVGLIVGVFLRDPPALSRQRPMPEFLALPEASRLVAREAFAARGSELRDRTRAFRQAQRQAGRVVSEEPFDRTKAETAFKALRDRAQDLQAVTHEAILAAAKGMPAADRERMIRYMFLAPRTEMPLASAPPPRHELPGKGT